MLQSGMTGEEIAKRAYEKYDGGIRETVETEENIGKLIIIDVLSGNYAFDKPGLRASAQLRSMNSNAALYGIRIGYNAVTTIGGVMKRIAL